jgi:uncharacterized protein YdiU (UPF0061 family)
MDTEPVIALHFDNSFVRDLPGDLAEDPAPRQVSGALYSRVAPTPVPAPQLLAYSPEVLELLGLPRALVHTQSFAAVFGGNALFPGMQPYAANYGGHQFGHWAGQLGDGRAITLGELIGPSGLRWELQLKGAGPTPYSRSADGRAVLRSSVREFLCSEAMHHLGIPTTRALCLVATGQGVVRDMFYNGNPQVEPGAIVCRVAPSFVRFGNFELPAARGDAQLLNRLIDFTIRRDFTELEGEQPARRAAWFSQVCERTAVMVAHWMRVGFVHGVMNTDNMSILGLTIDYGPYGWVDNFDLNWTPNTTDAQGRRYRFGNQPQIAFWNLNQLANALASVFESNDPLHAGLQRYVDVFTAATRQHVAAKLGLSSCLESDVDLMQALYVLLEEGEVDMTSFFRELSSVDLTVPQLAPLESAFYNPAQREVMRSRFQEWLERYAQRARSEQSSTETRRTLMHAANPRYVLRNYLAQQAIDRAEQGDFAGIHELLDVMRHPYQDQPARAAFAQLRPDWARQRAGCSMLSCSS